MTVLSAKAAQPLLAAKVVTYKYYYLDFLGNL